jgi:hypothetical protein
MSKASSRGYVFFPTKSSTWREAFFPPEIYSIPIKTIELQHVPTVDRFLVTNFNGNSSQRGYGRCALRLTKSASSIYFTQSGIWKKGLLLEETATS